MALPLASMYANHMTTIISLYIAVCLLFPSTHLYETYTPKKVYTLHHSYHCHSFFVISIFCTVNWLGTRTEKKILLCFVSNDLRDLICYRGISKTSPPAGCKHAGKHTWVAGCSERSRSRLLACRCLTQATGRAFVALHFSQQQLSLNEKGKSDSNKPSRTIRRCNACHGAHEASWRANTVQLTVFRPAVVVEHSCMLVLYVYGMRRCRSRIMLRDFSCVA
jgi:hypothetical protein